MKNRESVRKIFIGCLAIMMAMAVLFAGSDPIQAAPKKAVKKVAVSVDRKTVTKKTIYLNVGDKKALKVKVVPAAAKKKVAYKSSSKTVAAVSTKGVVTAKKAGTARIQVTVTGKNNKKISTYVKVKVKAAGNPADPADPVEVQGVTVSPASITMGIGDTVRLRAAVSPANAANKAVKWYSSAPRIVSVDQNGLVTRLKENGDDVEVYARTVDGGYEACCRILELSRRERFNRIYINSITLNKSSMILDGSVNPSEYLSASVQYSSTEFYGYDESTIPLIWESSNENVVKVRGTGFDLYKALVSYVGRGTATITAYAMDAKKNRTAVATCEVTSIVRPTSLSVNEFPATMMVGDQRQMDITVGPEDADCADKFDFTTSDPSVVTVDENGHVKAVGTGKATLRVELTDFKAIGQSVNVVVYPYIFDDEDLKVSNPPVYAIKRMNNKQTSDNDLNYISSSRTITGESGNEIKLNNDLSYDEKTETYYDKETMVLYTNNGWTPSSRMITNISFSADTEVKEVSFESIIYAYYSIASGNSTTYKTVECARISGTIDRSSYKGDPDVTEFSYQDAYDTADEGEESVDRSEQYVAALDTVVRLAVAYAVDDMDYLLRKNLGMHVSDLGFTSFMTDNITDHTESYEPSESITLSRKSVTIESSNSAGLLRPPTNEANVRISSSSPKDSYHVVSSDPSICTAHCIGGDSVRITGVSAGTAFVTVMTWDGLVYDTIEVKVTGTPSESESDVIKDVTSEREKLISYLTKNGTQNLSKDLVDVSVSRSGNTVYLTAKKYKNTYNNGSYLKSGTSDWTINMSFDLNTVDMKGTFRKSGMYSVPISIKKGSSWRSGAISVDCSNINWNSGYYFTDSYVTGSVHASEVSTAMSMWSSIFSKARVTGTSLGF